jgi:hypothetical protein
MHNGQTDSLGGHPWKTQQAFVSDRSALGKSAPRISIPRFQREFLDALANSDFFL